jgi:hypothetical protein
MSALDRLDQHLDASDTYEQGPHLRSRTLQCVPTANDLSGQMGRMAFAGDDAVGSVFRCFRATCSTSVAVGAGGSGEPHAPLRLRVGARGLEPPTSAV